MRVQNFKDALKNGGARPNQFRVDLQVPSGVQKPNSDQQLLVTGAALPASTVNPVITQFRGREVKFAGERIYDPWTITIINDNEFSLRQPFEEWMDKINKHSNNSGAIAWNDYQVDLSSSFFSKGTNDLKNLVNINESLEIAKILEIWKTNI